MGAYNKWKADHNIKGAFDRIDGKEVDLSKLFLLVGSMGGMKEVGRSFRSLHDCCCSQPGCIRLTSAICGPQSAPESAFRTSVGGI